MNPDLDNNLLEWSSSLIPEYHEMKEESPKTEMFWVLTNESFFQSFQGLQL